MCVKGKQVRPLGCTLLSEPSTRRDFHQCSEAWRREIPGVSGHGRRCFGGFKAPLIRDDAAQISTNDACSLAVSWFGSTRAVGRSKTIITWSIPRRISTSGGDADFIDGGMTPWGQPGRWMCRAAAVAAA